mmetsp:Transcript_20132/g.47122  ORF Transcript_20132/g.47122 Transcript_20132/m.47122 type:complete len:225 (+) Transcript_20132:1303-1977(+)
MPVVVSLWAAAAAAATRWWWIVRTMMMKGRTTGHVVPKSRGFPADTAALVSGRRSGTEGSSAATHRHGPWSLSRHALVGQRSAVSVSTAGSVGAIVGTRKRGRPVQVAISRRKRAVVLRSRSLVVAIHGTEIAIVASPLAIPVAVGSKSRVWFFSRIRFVQNVAVAPAANRGSSGNGIPILVAHINRIAHVPRYISRSVPRRTPHSVSKWWFVSPRKVPRSVSS